MFGNQSKRPYKMDEVRTSIEKMLDSYDSANGNRFSGSFINSSADGKYTAVSPALCAHNFNCIHSASCSLGCVGKKVCNDDSTSSPFLKRRRADDCDSESSISYSNISCNSTLNSSSQWEMRILKADLIEANTKVSCRGERARQNKCDKFA